jgi:hypothetical protein
MTEMDSQEEKADVSIQQYALWILEGGKNISKTLEFSTHF